MTAITIRDHQKLKTNLESALTAYCDLSKKKFQFFGGPGDEGLARAKFILAQLKAIRDLSNATEQQNLEILFAAVIKSEVFKSTVGRLRNLILDRVVATSKEFTFEVGAEHYELSSVRTRKAALEKKLVEHDTFLQLAAHSNYTEANYSVSLGLPQDFHVCTFSFSRTEVMKTAAEDITTDQNRTAINELITKIDHVIARKKISEKVGAFELTGM